MTASVVGPKTITLANGEQVALSSVRKIVFGYSTAPSEKLRITWEANGVRHVDFAPQTFDTITVDVGGVEKALAVSNLRDLVRASAPQ